MIKSIPLFCFLLVAISYTSFTQKDEVLSIKYIRNKIDNLGISLKSDIQLDKMYLDINAEGERWIYIEILKIDGLKSDQYSLSRELAEQMTKMIFKSINYDLEETISFKSFATILESKSIKGVEFRTNNNTFHINWSEILKVDIAKDE